MHYLVVIPDNAHIIHNIHNFFENLSTVYEVFTSFKALDLCFN